MTEFWVKVAAWAKAFAEEHGWTVVTALILLVVGWLVARWLAAIVRRVAEKSGRIDKTLAPLFVRLVRWSVLAITLVAVLEQFGVDTTSIIALLGAAGLAIGLALKDTIGDVAAGVVLLVLRPFDVGDAVKIGGTIGNVETIDLFETKLKTPDGVPLVMPNSSVRSSVIENYTRAATRRIDLMIGIGYDDDIQKALEAITEVVGADERVLSDPEPLLKVNDLGDSSVNLLVRVWVPGPDFFAAKLDLTRAIKERLDTEGISIPFPQRDVHLFQRSA